MRPKAFAGHDIFNAVAVHVDQIHGVKLRKFNAVFIVLRLLVHEGMLLEGDLVSLFHLLEPGQSISMRGEAGDNIIEAVAIHVIDVHLRATAAELLWMLHPLRISFERFRLLPPTRSLQKISLPIAIHISKTEAMRK